MPKFVLDAIDLNLVPDFACPVRFARPGSPGLFLTQSIKVDKTLLPESAQDTPLPRSVRMYRRAVEDVSAIMTTRAAIA